MERNNLTWGQIIDWLYENQSNLNPKHKILVEFADFFGAEAGATPEDTAANIVVTIKEGQTDLSNESNWREEDLTIYLNPTN